MWQRKRRTEMETGGIQQGKDPAPQCRGGVRFGARCGGGLEEGLVALESVLGAIADIDVRVECVQLYPRCLCGRSTHCFGSTHCGVKRDSAKRTFVARLKKGICTTGTFGDAHPSSRSESIRHNVSHQDLVGTAAKLLYSLLVAYILKGYRL